MRRRTLLWTNFESSPVRSSKTATSCVAKISSAEDTTGGVRRGGVRANTKPSNRKLARPEISVRRVPTVQRVRNRTARPEVVKPTAGGATEGFRREGVRANTKPPRRKLARPRFSVRRVPSLRRVRNRTEPPGDVKPTAGGCDRRSPSARRAC